MSSSVVTWPDRATVERALRAWVLAERARRPELRRLGFFGSYGRGDWGPGSDLDLVLPGPAALALTDLGAGQGDAESFLSPGELDAPGVTLVTGGDVLEAHGAIRHA